MRCVLCAVFFFNDTATTEIYTLSLHDALPISLGAGPPRVGVALQPGGEEGQGLAPAALELERRQADVLGQVDRKSTRLNSSHANISYAVFCLKKKITAL